VRFFYDLVFFPDEPLKASPSREHSPCQVLLVDDLAIVRTVLLLILNIGSEPLHHAQAEVEVVELVCELAHPLHLLLGLILLELDSSSKLREYPLHDLEPLELPGASPLPVTFVDEPIEGAKDILFEQLLVVELAGPLNLLDFLFSSQTHFFLLSCFFQFGLPSLLLLLHLPLVGSHLFIFLGLLLLLLQQLPFLFLQL